MTPEEFKELLKAEGNPAVQYVDGKFSWDNQLRLVFPSSKAVNISIDSDYDFQWFDFETDEERVINNSKIAESNSKLREQLHDMNDNVIERMKEKYSQPFPFESLMFKTNPNG